MVVGWSKNQKSGAVCLCVLARDLGRRAAGKLKDNSDMFGMFLFMFGAVSRILYSLWASIGCIHSSHPIEKNENKKQRMHIFIQLRLIRWKTGLANRFSSVVCGCVSRMDLIFWRKNQTFIRRALLTHARQSEMFVKDSCCEHMHIFIHLRLIRWKTGLYCL